MRFFIFYCIYVYFFLLCHNENFVDGMIKSATSMPSSSHGNSMGEKGKAKMGEKNISVTKVERNRKKILFIVRNIHFSNYQIFVG